MTVWLKYYQIMYKMCKLIGFIDINQIMYGTKNYS